MRQFKRPVALAIALLALAVMLGACNGENTAEEATPPPSASALLDDATRQIASATSFVIEISVSGLPVQIQVSGVVLPDEIALVFEYARGAFVAPDRLQAAIDVRIGDAVARTEVIAVGEDQYMRGDLLTQGNWIRETVIANFSPGDLLAPDTGIPNALAKVQNLEMVERTDLDGVPVHHLTGTIDANDVYSLTFGLIGSREGQVLLDIFLLSDGNRVEQIVMQEPLPDGAEEGAEPTRWTINVLDYNQDIEIAAPELSG